MTNEEQNALRLLLREEVNAAIYASEQRMGERFGRLDGSIDQLNGRMDQLDGRMDQFDGRMDQLNGRMDRLDGRMDQLNGRMDRLDGRMDQLDGRIGRLDGRVDRLEAGQRELQTNVAEIKVELMEVISVLDDASRAINEIQASQRALELKVEENTLALKHDMKRLEISVQNFAKVFIDMNGTTNARITVHERMPIEETHPYFPYSTSTE